MTHVRWLAETFPLLLAKAAPSGGVTDPPDVFTAGTASLAGSLPEFFHVQLLGTLTLWQLTGLTLLIAVGLVGCSLVQKLALGVARKASSLTKSAWDDQLLDSAKGPLKFLLFAVVLASGSRALALGEGAQHAVDVISRWIALVAVAWFSLRFVKFASKLIEKRVTERSGADVGRVRGVKTQMIVLRRVLDAAIYVLTLSLILLQLESVRSIGMSLLASAGVAGLVIGLAAQKTISTLLAGIQLSVTQPMRIGDTVIVENEWGWIEEITLTYVVVKVWDLRRLVIPMTYFLEKPFQNWSKVTPDIMGTVELYTDYRVDIAALRAELVRVLKHAPEGLWDGKVQNIQVTDCSPQTMKLRVLVSSPDAGRNWDLRVHVREKLIDFLQKQPAGLPRIRAEIAGNESFARNEVLAAPMLAAPKRA